MLRLLKYKTVEENWIEKSLAPFDARNLLQYDKDRETTAVVPCKVFTQFREHIEGIKYFKEDWLSESTNQCLFNAINHTGGVSHKKIVSLLVQHGSSSNYEYILFVEVLKTCYLHTEKIYKLVYYSQKYCFKHYF